MEHYSTIPSTRETRLALGETRLQRIRFNLGWYALRLFIPELFRPTGVSRTIVLLNLDRRQTRNAVHRWAEGVCKAEKVEAKALRLRQQGRLFRY